MEKSFEPSPFKLEKLRKRGEYVKAEMLARALAFAAALLTVIAVVQINFGSYLRVFEQCFQGEAEVLLKYHELLVLRLMTYTLMPLLAAVLTGFAVQLCFARWHILKEYKGFNLDFMKAEQIFKRFWKAGYKALMMFVPFIISLALAVIAVGSNAQSWLMVFEAEVQPMAGHMFGGYVVVLLLVWLCLIGFAGVDYLVERFFFLKQNRMDHKEMKDEYKENEGDPLVKMQRKHLAQEYAQGSLQQRVRQSRVIIVEV